MLPQLATVPEHVVVVVVGVSRGVREDGQTVNDAGVLGAISSRIPGRAADGALVFSWGGEWVRGATRCFTLVGAVNGGHLDVVQYLVEKAGADINAVWIDMSPLSHAVMFNRKAIEASLRSQGAKEPEKRG